MRSPPVLGLEGEEQKGFALRSRRCTTQSSFSYDDIYHRHAHLQRKGVPIQIAAHKPVLYILSFENTHIYPHIVSYVNYFQFIS